MAEIPDPFKHIGRLLHYAARDISDEAQDKLTDELFGIHNNHTGKKKLSEMLEPKTAKWVIPTLKKARIEWNRLHPKIPFPDLDDPKNAMVIQELAEGVERENHRKTLRRMAGELDDY